MRQGRHTSRPCLHNSQSALGIRSRCFTELMSIAERDRESICLVVLRENARDLLKMIDVVMPNLQ